MKIGVIGGSGIKRNELFLPEDYVNVPTPFGDPSDKISIGRLGETQIFLIPRHGENHSIPPSAVNYRANIWALKALQCTHIIATTATSSLQEDIHPGDLLLLSSFLNRTTLRENSFYNGELGVGHVPMQPAFCERMNHILYKICEEEGIRCHGSGMVVTTEGPRFPSRAESALYHQWGADIFNMTTFPEVCLAKELSILYACIASVTDFCYWTPQPNPMKLESVIKIFDDNAKKVIKLIKRSIPLIQRQNWDEEIRTLEVVVRRSTFRRGIPVCPASYRPPWIVQEQYPLLEDINFKPNQTKNSLEDMTNKDMKYRQAEPPPPPPPLPLSPPPTPPLPPPPLPSVPLSPPSYTISVPSSAVILQRSHPVINSNRVESTSNTTTLPNEQPPLIGYSSSANLKPLAFMPPSAHLASRKFPVDPHPILPNYFRSSSLPTNLQTSTFPQRTPVYMTPEPSQTSTYSGPRNQEDNDQLMNYRTSEELSLRRPQTTVQSPPIVQDFPRNIFNPPSAVLQQTMIHSPQTTDKPSPNILRNLAMSSASGAFNTMPRGINMPQTNITLSSTIFNPLQPSNDNKTSGVPLDTFLVRKPVTYPSTQFQTPEPTISESLGITPNAYTAPLQNNVPNQIERNFRLNSPEIIVEQKIIHPPEVTTSYSPPNVVNRPQNLTQEIIPLSPSPTRNSVDRSQIPTEPPRQPAPEPVTTCTHDFPPTIIHLSSAICHPPPTVTEVNQLIKYPPPQILDSPPIFSSNQPSSLGSRTIDNRQQQDLSEAPNDFKPPSPEPAIADLSLTTERPEIMSMPEIGSIE